MVRTGLSGHVSHIFQNGRKGTDMDGKVEIVVTVTMSYKVLEENMCDETDFQHESRFWGNEVKSLMRREGYEGRIEDVTVETAETFETRISS